MVRGRLNFFLPDHGYSDTEDHRAITFPDGNGGTGICHQPTNFIGAMNFLQSPGEDVFLIGSRYVFRLLILFRKK